MKKSGPIHKLEKIIVDSLKARGMTEGEAMAALHRVEEWAAKAFNSPDGFDNGAYSETTDNFEILREEVKFYNVDVLYATDLALLCQIDSQKVWIPFSQLIRGKNEVWEKGDMGVLVVTEWIATQKDLI